MTSDRFTPTRDDDYRRLVDGLDRVVTGLTDLQAVLNNEPELQRDLWHYANTVRTAADLLFRLRQERQR